MDLAMVLDWLGGRSFVLRRARSARRGRLTAAPLRPECLEQRRLLTVSASMVGSELVVDISGVDSATITQGSSNNVVVYDSTGTDVFSSGVAPVGAASVTDILVVPSGQNDQVLFTAIDTANAYTALKTITVQADSSGAVTTIGNTITTSGAQSYDGPVDVPSATTLVTTNSAVTFGSTIDDFQAAGGSLTVSPGSGDVQFGGAVGGTAPIASLTVNGTGTTTLDGNVTTNFAETYNGPVVLGGNAVLTSKSNSDVSFASTVDAATSGSQSLEIAAGSGNITFAGAVGGNTALGEVTVDSANNLTVQSAFQAASLTQSSGTGTTELDGAVSLSGVTGLSLTTAAVTLKAPTITATVGTTAPIVFSAPVTLAGDVVIDASAGGGDVTFGSTLDGAFGLTVNTSGTTTFDGAVGANSPLASVTTDAAGSTDLNGGSVATTGGQIYNDAVHLGAATALTSSGGGDITFDGEVDGAFDLTVNTAGTTTFFEAVGANTALADLVTDAAGSTDLLGGGVNTTGNQTYNDAVSLGTADDHLTSTGGGNITFGGTMDGAGGLNVTTAGTTTFDGAVGATNALSDIVIDGTGATDLNGGSVTTTGGQAFDGAVNLGAGTTLTSTGSGEISFGSTLDGAFSLTANTAYHTVFDGAVGATTALASVTTGPKGDTVINSVTTTGAQTYNNPTLLGGLNTRLTSTSGGAVMFGSTLDGGGLTVSTSGTTTFAGVVGGSFAVSSITVAAAGNTDLNGGSVTTTGAQSYGNSVHLGAATTLTSSSNGNIIFGSTLDGAFSLTVNTGGSVTFGGAVGSTTPLASVTIDNAPTAVNGGSIATTGAQSFNGAVVLGAAVTLTSTGGGNVTFGSTLDGAVGLTVNTAGTTNFDGTVGATTALADISISGAKNVTVASSLSAGSFVQVSGTGTTALDGSVTLSDAIGLSLTTTAVSISGANITTTAAAAPVTVAAPVTLSADLVIDTSAGGGSVNFGGTVDGASGVAPGTVNLTVNAGAGRIVLDGAIGGVTSLASLTLDGTGATILAGGAVSTTGGQTYNESLTLAADTKLDSAVGGATTGGTITFGAVDGAHQLTLTAGIGNVTFTGGVGSATPLSAVTITSARDVMLGQAAGGQFDAGSISVSGLIGILTVNDTIVPGSAATLQAPTIDFAASQTFGSASVSLVTTSLMLSSGITLAGTGTLAIQPRSSSETIHIDGSGEGLSLPASTLAALLGFGKISIGSPTATGTLSVDAATTFTSPVELDLEPGGAGKVIVNGTLTDSADGATPGITIHGSGDTTILNGDVVTHGTPIVIDDSIVLGSPSTIRLDTTAGGSAPGGAAITLASPGTVNDDRPGSSALVLNGGTSGTVTLAGAIGTSVPITALTTIGSIIDLSGGSVVTYKNQSYTGNVSLLSGLSIDTTAGGKTSGGNVQFSNALNGRQNLTIAAGSGNVTFAEAVGASTPLGDVTINSGNNVTVQSTFSAGSLTQANGSGVTQLNGAVILSDTKGLSITTSAVQVAAPTITVSAVGAPVTLAAPVTLMANVTINTAKGVLGPVLFGSSLDSDSLTTPRALTIDGNATFDGSIGATYPLASLTVTGTSFMKEGNAHVVNSTFEQPVTLTTDTTLYGNVTFAGSVDSLSANPPLSLTIDALPGGTGLVVFYAPVGGIHALKSLTVNVPAAFKTSVNGTSHGGAVTTALTQTYGGSTTFQGNANLVTTQGDVDFNDVVTLGSGASATISSNSGNVSFNGTIDGSSALTTDTPGATTFAADVGASSALTSIHITGPTNLGGPVPIGMAMVQSQPRKSVPLTAAPVILAVNCNGAQSYDGPVLVQASVSLSTLTSGDIVFGSTVDSMNASELTVDTLVNNNNTTTATGVVQFDGPVGSLGQLANLAVLTGGPFMLNTPVNSAGNIIVTVHQNSGGPAANIEVTAAATLNASGQLKLLSSNNVDIDAGSTIANPSGTITIKCDYLNGAGAEINLAGAINSPNIQISGGGNDLLYINDPGAVPGTDDGQTLAGFGFAGSTTIGYSGVHPEIITPLEVPTIEAGTAGSEGETIATLLESSAAFSGEAVVADVLPGIAITGLNDPNTADGKWQFSTDGGTTWTDFGSPSDTNALLLGANDEIHFLSGSNVVARNGFVFRAWDGHTGTDGSTYNTNGGTAMGFSGSTQTVTIQVVAPSPPGGTYVIGSGTITVPANLGILRYVPTGSNENVTSGTVMGDQGGTFAFNADGSFKFTPGASFPGYDSANATVTDSHGNQITAPVAVLSQHAGVVWKFYESVLNRTPDPGGLQYWTQDFDNGGKTGDIADGFFESDELLNEIITGYYQQYLGRTPDANGLAYWRGVWHATGGPEGIKAGFADSPEFYNANGGTPASWLTGLYEKILNRTPDPSGYQFWLNFYQQQLAAGADPGVTRQTIGLGFFDSAEAYGNYVTGWYQEYLFRAPTDAEKAQYVAQMEAGSTDRTIEQEVTNLPEYASNPPTPSAGTAALLPDYYQSQGSAQSQAAISAKDAVFSAM